MLKTGKLSSLYEIDRSSLNYYVRTGLLQPKVLDNQYHIYTFEDIVALGQVRQYRGLNFDTDQIKSILYEKEVDEIIEAAYNKQSEINEEIKKLQLKQSMLQNLMDSLTFIQKGMDKIVVANTEAYYFIRKENITSEILMEIYKYMPSSEFRVKLDEECNIEIEELHETQGLALKEKWVKEFNLAIPDNALYYPSQSKGLTVFSLKDDLEFAKEKFKNIKRELSQMGYQMKNEITIYTYLTKYSSEKRNFNVLCFIPIE